VFLNSIANEQRYPNQMTYFFSCIYLHIFSDNSDPQSSKVQERIAQILIERLEVSEPHPWGLMITFRELIQIHKYEFLKKKFIKENQEGIDHLFQSRLAKFEHYYSLLQSGQKN
jgi:CCR4-NOT transcription complex subunit 1